MATIAPLHSLVSSVTEGAETAELIISADVSPHSFRLKPSQVRTMSNSRAVFYIGGGFEHFPEGTLDSLPEKVKRIAIAEKSGINFQRRQGQAENLHIWLSPNNAEKIARAVARELSLITPGNKKLYKKNVRATIKRLRKLDAKIKRTLAGLKQKPYAVMHDAYLYFERYYGLKTAVGAVTGPLETESSARDIRDTRRKLIQTGASCLFVEPQSDRKKALTIVEGSNVKISDLDPLGAGITPGPDLYFEMMENLAESFAKCMK